MVIFSGTPFSRWHARRSNARRRSRGVRAAGSQSFGQPCRRQGRGTSTDRSFDVSLVLAPTQADRALAPAKQLGQHRQHLDRPPMHRCVVDHHAALGHHLVQVAQAQRPRRVPVNTHRHHLDPVVQPLENLGQRIIRRSFSPGPVSSAHLSGCGLLQQNHCPCQALRIGPDPGTGHRVEGSAIRECEMRAGRQGGRNRERRSVASLNARRACRILAATNGALATPTVRTLTKHCRRSPDMLA